MLKDTTVSTSLPHKYVMEEKDFNMNKFKSNFIVLFPNKSRFQARKFLSINYYQCSRRVLLSELQNILYFIHNGEVCGPGFLSPYLLSATLVLCTVTVYTLGTSE